MTDNSLADYSPKRPSRVTLVLTPEVTRPGLEATANILYRESLESLGDAATGDRPTWYELPRAQRIKWRQRALKLLREPIE